MHLLTASKIRIAAALVLWVTPLSYCFLRTTTIPLLPAQCKVIAFHGSGLTIASPRRCVAPHRGHFAAAASDNIDRPHLHTSPQQPLPIMSVVDQVGQASLSIKRAVASGINRHTIRLLLPLIGATELDDWPGGARQMREAAQPLMTTILQETFATENIQTSVIDASDGVAAMMAQCVSAKDDSCAVLLPTADSIAQSVASKLDEQVGQSRNLFLVNPQYRRRSDFGGVFGRPD
jgi:Domain of unknown function (DUF1995)